MSTALDTSKAPAVGGAVALQYVPLAALSEHPLNPRKRFDPVKLQELADSIKATNGVLEPLLVRPVPVPAKDRGMDGGIGLQILAGTRRFRAAKLAGQTQLPVFVRDMDDVAALEVLVVDNDQREDVHPLEEAMGYQQLMERGKWDVTRLASRIGRSVKYVYDRVKLLALTKDAQKLFLEDRFTAGHAILLARLKPEDQKRAIGLLDVKKGPGRYGYDQIGAGGGLFETEPGLDFGDKEPGPWDDIKARSVRELEHWINRHVRLEAKEADPMIFPELVDTVAAAEEKKEKVVRITRNEITPAALRDGPKAILGRSWKRADGKQGSKTCDHSIIGNVVIGADRGEAFRVCVAKDKCTVHWGELIRARQKRERALTKATKGKEGVDRELARQRIQQEQEAKEKAERERWAKAKPAVVTALVATLKTAPTGAAGALGKIVLEEWDQSVAWNHAVKQSAGKHFGAGKSADDLVRYMGLTLLLRDLDQNPMEDAAFYLKPLGIDVKKIVALAAPEPKPAKAAATKKPAKPAPKKARKK